MIGWFWLRIRILLQKLPRKWSFVFQQQIQAHYLQTCVIIFYIININGDYYMALLDWLSAEMKEKRPHMQNKKVLFHKGNVPYHKSLKTMVKLNELSFELLPYSPYSPYLSPSDYWLFADLKSCSRERDLAPIKDWLSKLRPILRVKTKHSTKKVSKSQRKIGINVLRLKETVLMNKVKFLEKIVFTWTGYVYNFARFSGKLFACSVF